MSFQTLINISFLADSPSTGSASQMRLSPLTILSQHVTSLTYQLAAEEVKDLTDTLIPDPTSLATPAERLITYIAMKAQTPFDVSVDRVANADVFTGLVSRGYFRLVSAEGQRIRQLKVRAGDQPVTLEIQVGHGS